MLIFCSPYVLFCKGSLIFFSLVIFKSCENKFLLLQTNQIEFLTEFFVIISFSIFFMFLLLSSTDFFSIYLALEGLGFSVYVLASISTEGLIAIEGAIKYFVFGALSGALYLVGSIFLFGSIGCLDLDFIYFFLLTDKFVLFSTEILIGFLLIIIAFCFKIGAFPFHTWVVDIYEAVWLPVLAFFSIVVKASLFFALYRILFYAMFPVLFLFQHIFGIIACGSMVFGTVCALREYRLKRFFAYLSISQVGFIFLGIASCNLLGFMSSFIYLFLYTLMNLILFCCFLNVEHRVTGRSMIYITDLYGLISYNVNISRILSLVSFAMAGLPPFGGFFGKLFIYFAVMSSELDLYVGFSLCLSILSSYYYLNLARHIYADKSFSPKLYCFKYTYN